MIGVEQVTLVLLAAGRSERYGDIGSKLDEVFLGRPLGAHVAVTLGDMPFKERIAVTGRAEIDYAAFGFQLIANDRPDEGLARSVGLGVACARDQGADAVLVALADMPRVTAAHIYRMLDAADGPDAVVASSDGAEPRPPALFGRDRFDFLLGLEGDQGARDLVRAGRHVVTSPAELIDVDTPEEFQRLCELVRSRDAITRAEARRSG